MQRAPLRTSCAILILVFSSAAVSRAGTVYWNAGTASGNTSPTSSTDVPATIAVGPISAGNNQGGEAFNNTVSASSGYTFLLNGVSTSASGGFNFGVDTLVGTSLDTSTSTYFSLTVTPDPGTFFQVASIGFGTRSTDKGAQAWTLRSSLDSFASDLVVPGTLPNNSSWLYVTADLTTPLAASTATEFRIYGYNVDGPQSFTSSTWRIDDIQVQFVPEPSTISMLAGTVALVSWAGLRKRWTRAAHQTPCNE